MIKSQRRHQDMEEDEQDDEVYLVDSDLDMMEEDQSGDLEQDINGTPDLYAIGRETFADSAAVDPARSARPAKRRRAE